MRIKPRDIGMVFLLCLLAALSCGTIGCAEVQALDPNKVAFNQYTQHGEKHDSLDRAPGDTLLTHIDSIEDVKQFMFHTASSVTALIATAGQPNVYRVLPLDDCGRVTVVTDVPAGASNWAEQRYYRNLQGGADHASTVIHVHHLGEVVGYVNIPPPPAADQFSTTSLYSTP